MVVLSTAVLLAVCAEAQPPPSPTTAPAGEPKITLSQDSWDFGTVRHLEKPDLTLTISNTGTAELRIAKVSSSCGCTAAQLEKFNLLPGESTPLKIIFNTRGKSGKTDATITIESNDKAAPKKVFSLQGEVKRAVQTEPDSAVFRLLGPDEVMTIPIRIVNISEQPMQLKLGPYMSGKFVAEVKEIRAGKEYQIDITTKPPISDRIVVDTLEVLTGLEDEPRVEISTQIVQTDRVNFLQPAILIFGNRSETIRCETEIEYFGSDPGFRITKVVCGDPHVVTELSDPLPPDAGRPGRKPTSIVTLVIAFPPETKFPAAGLPITVYTNDPEYPEIKTYATPDMARYRDLTLRGRGISQRKSP